MVMGTRLAKGMLLAAPLLLLLGMVAFLFGSGPAGWDEIVDGLRWYLAARWEHRALLLPALGALLVVWAGWLGLALRNRARFRAGAAGRVAAAPSPPGLETRLMATRRELESALLRGRHRPEISLDALLGALVDLEVGELVVEPGEMVVTACLVLPDGSRHPLSSMGLAQYRELLDQATLVGGLGQAGEGGEVEIDLRSPGRSDRIRLGRHDGPRGPVLRLRLAASGATGPVRPRQRATVLRLEAGPDVRRRSGEVSGLSFVGPDEITDSRSGLLAGIDPSSEPEIAPVVTPEEKRPVRGVEAWLALASALLLLLVLGALLWPAQAWALRRLLEGRTTAPWREISLVVESRPSGARVQVGGERRGKTPLRLREPCGRRWLEVIIEAPGHLAWQWTGICPPRGELRLKATLQPL